MGCCLLVRSAHLCANARQLRRLAFSPDGRLMATVSTDDTMIIWDTVTWHPRTVLSEPAGHSITRPLRPMGGSSPLPAPMERSGSGVQSSGRSHSTLKGDRPITGRSSVSPSRPTDALLATASAVLGLTLLGYFRGATTQDPMGERGRRYDGGIFTHERSAVLGTIREKIRALGHRRPPGRRRSGAVVPQRVISLVFSADGGALLRAAVMAASGGTGRCSNRTPVFHSCGIGRISIATRNGEMKPGRECGMKIRGNRPPCPRNHSGSGGSGSTGSQG